LALSILLRLWGLLGQLALSILLALLIQFGLYFHLILLAPVNLIHQV
jgi:hypothetical protein